MKPTACLLLGMCIIHLTATAQVINNGSAIVVSSGTNLVLNNLSLQNNGVFHQTAGTVVFSGNSNSTISGTTSPVFYTLQLNKPSATLQLQTGTQISHELQFTNGLLQLSGKNILLDPTALLTGENETSHTAGSAGGYVEITQNLNAPSSQNPGNLGVLISSSQNLGSVTIRRGHQLQTNLTGASSSIFRSYDIIPVNNSSLNATLRFQYLDAELNGLDENNLSLWKTNDNVNWTNLGQSSASTAGNYVEQTGINSFSRFTLAMPVVNLPVKWSSFNTQCNGNGIRISWRTEVEQNTSGFTIRRSSDGRSWTSIGVVPAAGNSTAPHDYSFDDTQAPSGTVYYQVQQKDIDGRATFSPVLRNNCGTREELAVFPNPARQNCWVQIQSENAATVVLRLYDHKGALVQQRTERIQQGSNQFQLYLGHLASGTYALMIVQPGGKTNLVKLQKY